MVSTTLTGVVLDGFDMDLPTQNVIEPKVTGWTKTMDRNGKSTYLLGDKGKNYWEQDQYSCKLIYCLTPVSNLSFSYKGNSREYGYRDPQSYLLDGGGKPVDNGTVELPGEGRMTSNPMKM